MKSIYFFATPNDIGQILRRFEGNAPLKFVETGTGFSSKRNEYLESTDIKDLGRSSHETGSQSIGYLVTLRETQTNIRASTKRTGATRWDLHSAGTGSIVLTPAGLWKEMLLPGNVGTVHDDPIAQKLMKWFQSALKAESVAKAGRFWLCSEALEFFDSGSRLSTTAEQSLPEFDLRPEHVKRLHEKFA